MKLHFTVEALIVLLTGFILLRILGKKTVGEMTGLEIITLLAMASMIGHAVKGDGLVKTIITLCVYVSLLLVVQYLALRFNWVEKWFMGRATLIIKDGQVITENLKKLRLTVDQLEAKLRATGIASISDVKCATLEISGHMGYELMRHAKPVTIGEMEKMLAQLEGKPRKQKPKPKANLFTEVVEQEHREPIRPELD
ncbi:DUF421 domain-containing protein [Paenibacillus thiaminolyticus]|uniref:DUF421 domain-containing protein n=1 Tax=Paenibacillus thiaminolyticus TaxID=49283 RepID=A0AAP9DRB1_PANTH|nr:YetF domain-containing protein [Paenibacillus thiaminolyticus]MCY9535959.1 DUF421 domain-containing protein [Paenibacillus thiaminolyticus]MCY9602380.1 DUF421 domain-containing protein [Paenibacillus thiaminolyticus]MCY9608775.1 DUF421 domain-containing protein [Paenibacillus thiaminolyticus]MCY9613522.1 DUF421 domain-containing protein [Paenibacillus thiaminolyticus]MCY9620340.1 DUF421 domain-containing protein [Paenibacillus thiaminolyticus]